MKGKIDFKKIAIGLAGILVIIFSFFKNGNQDTSPTTETTQIEQPTEQIVDNNQNNKNTEVVDFETNTTVTTTTNDDNKTPRQVTDDVPTGNQRLTYEGKDLVLTNHAKCRMECREISKDEIAEVIKEGKENIKKSNPNDTRCPTIALEDWTKDGQLVRIIVANCGDVAKLVTVIDLKNDYDCHCD